MLGRMFRPINPVSTAPAQVGGHFGIIWLRKEGVDVFKKQGLRECVCNVSNKDSTVGGDERLCSSESAFPPPPQVSRILYSFATAFRRSAKKALMSSQQAPPLTPDSDLFTFNVSLEIKEDDGKGTFRWETRKRAGV